jgi:hypothetical protein
MSTCLASENLQGETFIKGKVNVGLDRASIRQI